MAKKKVRSAIRSIEENLARSNFGTFVHYAFREVHGQTLGDQPYIHHICNSISQLIESANNRLLINLPPQHLKSFVGSVCLAAYLLGKNPRLRIILIAYSSAFAGELCDRVRNLMQTPWYQRLFETRIREGHSRAGDFRMREGGGVFASAATGGITGRAADFVIYDDPHEIIDWNDEQKLDRVWSNFNTVLSRLNDRVNGRVLVIAHRVSETDISSHLLAEEGWSYLRLPLVAEEERTYELGHEAWVRKKRDVLRPEAYPEKEIERLRRRQTAPPFSLFYQQGLDSQAITRAKPEDFQSFWQSQYIPARVVLSIDPGQSAAPGGSRSVIQAWKFHDKKYFLIDEFCETVDAEGLRRAFWRFVRKHNPSVALIENAANGFALHALVRQKAKFLLKPITARPDSKGTRLHDHLPKISSKQVYLPDSADWREAFVDEVVSFPGKYDDQVDAMTMYFDFMDGNPIIPPPPSRATGVLLPGRSSSGIRRF